MNILKSPYMLAFAAATLLSGSSPAQTLDQSLTVEGRYKPEIIAADRLSLFPTLLQLTAPESNMDYEQKGVFANFAPDALPMPATGWRTVKDFSTTRGYLDLRLGSWLNSSLSAGYQPVRTDDTRLNLRLQHNSTSLWRPSEKHYPDMWLNGEPTKRFRYDETFGADLRHRVGDTGILSADLQYHLGYFNYYGSALDVSDDGAKDNAPTQTLNDMYAKVAWTAAPAGNLSYDLTADFRHFAFRSDYYLSHFYGWCGTTGLSGTVPETYNMSLIHRIKGARENELNVGGGLSYRLGNQSALNVGLKYTGIYYADDPSAHRLQLTPGYEWKNSTASLRIGVNAAYTLISGLDSYSYPYEESGGHNKFRIAPDIRFSVRSGIIAFSASASGGTDFRTVSWRHQMNYYDDPGLCQYSPAYTPVDALVGVRLNPGGKFTIGLEGGWKKTLHEAVGGLYMTDLNNYVEGWMPHHDRIDVWAQYRRHLRSGLDMHGFHGAFNIGYDFSKYFAVSGRATYQPQKGNTGILNGFDRPKYTVEATALSHPVDPLTLRLDYNLRACRYLLPGNVSLLNLSADYKITDRISVGAELNNLLNRHEEALPYLPTEGFNAAAGFQFLF